MRRPMTHLLEALLRDHRSLVDKVYCPAMLHRHEQTFSSSFRRLRDRRDRSECVGAVISQPFLCSCSLAQLYSTALSLSLSAVSGHSGIRLALHHLHASRFSCILTRNKQLSGLPEHSLKYTLSRTAVPTSCGWARGRYQCSGQGIG